MALPLAGKYFELPVESGSSWAAKLLLSLGAEIKEKGTALENEVHKSWAVSGAMFLTGAGDSAPKLCPAPLASAMQGALLALRQLTVLSLPNDFDAGILLAERAALAGYGRQGAISCGGSCRFFPVDDDWVAFNVARADDWELMPALFGGQQVSNWDSLAAAVKNIKAASLASSAMLLGLAFSPMHTPADKRQWFKVCATGQPAIGNRAVPLVIDLSALWAGPLSTNVLSLAGAKVIKVESTTRPDGARNGSVDFFDLLNAGKASVALDLTTLTGRQQLEQLLRKADIVIESSRPRALKQMGIDAEKIVRETPGITWVSITGYGRNEANAQRIAYGDDAGVAAGLSALMLQHHGEAMFCADAIADPLTGMHVALAAMAFWLSGGGCMLDVSLCSVVQNCIEVDVEPVSMPVERVATHWELDLQGERIVVMPPQARAISGSARPLGADTETVLHEYGIPC